MSEGLPDLDNPVSGQFWRAAKQKRLELSFCQQCAELVWYPQSPSPCCGADLDWQEIGSDARLVSWTEVLAPINPYFEAPYTVALVEPADQPQARIVSRIMHSANDRLRCDMPLRLDFVELTRQTQGQQDPQSFTAPVFRPA